MLGMFRENDHGWKDHSREMIYKTLKRRQKCDIEEGVQIEMAVDFTWLMVPNEIPGNLDLEKEGRKWTKGEWTKDCRKGSPQEVLTVYFYSSCAVSRPPVILVPTSALRIMQQLHGEPYSRGCSAVIHTLGIRQKSCGHVRRTGVGRSGGKINKLVEEWWD